MTMLKKIIGREREQKLIEEYIQSDKPELIAVYGRRRVGKTYLIRKFFDDDIYIIAHLLGHKQVSSTQCYVRPSDKLCQQAIRLLDK